MELQMTGRVPCQERRLQVARILLADAVPASRLTLKSLLSRAGEGVDCAATTGEALGKLDRNEYQLVLADLRAESEEASAGVLAYARQKDFRPATALLNSDLTGTFPVRENVVRISHENISYLLGRIAELIGARADRRLRNRIDRCWLA